MHFECPETPPHMGRQVLAAPHIYGQVSGEANRLESASPIYLHEPGNLGAQQVDNSNETRYYVSHDKKFC